MSIPVATITNVTTGQTLPNTVDVQELEIHRALNRIPTAKLHLLDGSVAKRTFQISESNFFGPGYRIRIALRYEGKTQDTTLFEGLVLRHAVESTSEGTSMRVELKDPSFILTRGRKSVVHRNVTDAQAFSDVLQAAKLQGSWEQPAQAPSYAELLQFNATDWDFLVSRAEAMGRVVDCHLAAVHAKPLELAAAGVKVEHGLHEVEELFLELDGSEPWAEVESLGWDAENLAGTVAAATTSAFKVGGRSPASAARLLGGVHETLVHPTPALPAELKAWADARLLRSHIAMLRGRVRLKGDAAWAPLSTVDIGGVAARFNGKALVSEVTHRVNEGGWSTELEIGLSAKAFAAQTDIAAPPAAALLPPARGLQLATVGGLTEDATGALRIQLKLPSLPEGQGLVWARLASPDAGSKRGYFFRPEIGDEVVVGYLEEDPRQPVVLGALFGKKNLPPPPVEKPTAANHLRVLYSRAGSRVVFDDDNQTITIATSSDGTADGQPATQVFLDQKNKLLEIKDEAGNSIKLDSKGITLYSAKDLHMEAQGNVTIKGAKIDLQ